MDELTQRVSGALAAIAAASSLAELEEQRVRLLGKKGEMPHHLMQLGQLDPEARRVRGAEINAFKEKLEAALGARRQRLESAELERRLESERVDVTLPGRRQAMGGRHPVTRTNRAHGSVLRGGGIRGVSMGPRSRTTGTTSNP